MGPHFDTGAIGFHGERRQPFLPRERTRQKILRTNPESLGADRRFLGIQCCLPHDTREGDGRDAGAYGLWFDGTLLVHFRIWPDCCRAGHQFQRCPADCRGGGHRRQPPHRAHGAHVAAGGADSWRHRHTPAGHSGPAGFPIRFQGHQSRADGCLAVAGGFFWRGFRRADGAGAGHEAHCRPGPHEHRGRVLRNFSAIPIVYFLREDGVVPSLVVVRGDGDRHFLVV